MPSQRFDPNQPWPFSKPPPYLNVFVARLPKGHDPDSFIRLEGPAAFQALIDAATPAGVWILERALDNLPDWMDED